MAIDSEEKVSVSPVIKRKELKKLAMFIRKRLGYKPLQKFNPIDVMENIMPQNLDENFTYLYTAVQDWTYGSSVHAVCDFENHNIQIREDVYEGACKGNARDIFTICHEISHYVLFHKFGAPVCFRIVEYDKTKNRLEFPEWQANTLTGLLCVTDEMISAANGDSTKLMSMSGLSKSAVNYCVDLRNKDRFYEQRRINNRNAKEVKRMKNRKKSSY